MKITKSQLREIIKEEITQVMSADDMAIDEQFSTSSADPYSDRDEQKEDLEEEQLNEIAPAILAAAGPIVMNALKNPQVQQALMTMIGPMIQKALGGGEGASPTAPAGATGTAE